MGGENKAKETVASHDDNSDLPPKLWGYIQQLLVNTESDEKLNLTRAHPKKSLEGFISYILFFYGLLVVFGILSNIILYIYIIRQKVYKDATYAYIINNIISDIVKCLVVLPISLYVMLIQNWTLGELLCTFLPMIQDIPLHVTMLTYVCLAWDRCRYLRNPDKPRFPALIGTIGSWLTSLCLVIPYPIYITYIDLGKVFESSELEGVSMCIINLVDDIKEYMRWTFLVTEYDYNLKKLRLKNNKFARHKCTFYMNLESEKFDQSQHQVGSVSHIGGDSPYEFIKKLWDDCSMNVNYLINCTENDIDII